MEEVLDRVGEGVDMGVEEAQRAAEMFGGSVTSRFLSFGGSPVAGQPYPPPPPIDPVAGAIQIVIPGVLSDSLWRHTIATAKSAGAIVLNANSQTNVPYASCERHVFHVRPSPHTLKALGAAKPDTRGAPELWSSSLTRFGADTLNKRFRARRGSRMDSSAWAGWFAVKCVWEATLQARAVTSSAVIDHLEKASTRFDGHKGTALYFGGSHELVQPLYLVEQGIVQELTPLITGTPVAQCR